MLLGREQEENEEIQPYLPYQVHATLMRILIIKSELLL